MKLFEILNKENLNKKFEDKMGNIFSVLRNINGNPLLYSECDNCNTPIQLTQEEMINMEFKECSEWKSCNFSYIVNNETNIVKLEYKEIRLEDNFINILDSLLGKGEEVTKDIIRNGKWYVKQQIKFYREIDKEKKVNNTEFNSHDCCGCGICPNCGSSIDTWNSKEYCYSCGQKLKW